MTIVLGLLAFLAAEGLLFFGVFRLLARALLREPPKDEKSGRLRVTDFAKGALERLVLAVGLWLGMQQILTLFSALKLGTRLKSKPDDQGFNDFYLMGNLISVLVAMGYSRALGAWPEVVAAVGRLFCG